MNDITKTTKLKDIYRTPIGHDILSLIAKQIGKTGAVFKNPFIGNLTFAIIQKFAGKKVDSTLFDTLISFINSCKDEITDFGNTATSAPQPAWWKEAVFYQIYPRSFCDTNNDHIGDLPGIISKLDYLHELGVTALWLSPIYDSPNDDNGYDIRDYKKIMHEFGTMEQFDTLLCECHKRSMHLIMDLVVNHTSDEHEWFQKALHSKTDNPYHEYYYFHDGSAENQPNNWTSLFSGKAWNYYPELGQYALHLFSKKQMDLNWTNPSVRAAVIDMVNWWLDKGVDGFRMDVITFISKTAGLPDGNTTIGAMSKMYGLEHYIYGPHLHEYIRELNEKAFAPHHAFSVGEAPVIGMSMSRLLTNESRKELNMVFNFDALESGAHQRFDIYNYDLNYYRTYVIDWMEQYGSGSWMSLFFDNHDNPRMISKIEKDASYHTVLAELLCAMQLTLRGTPFIYQGDEWGIPNHSFSSMQDITDVESRNLYETLLSKMNPQEAFTKICAGTRDHARILLPWTPAEREQQSAKEEVFCFYKKMISIRTKSPSLLYGTFSVVSKKKNRFFYIRSPYPSESYSYFIECALSRKQVHKAKLPPDAELVLSNYKTRSKRLRAYEINVYRFIDRR